MRTKQLVDFKSRITSEQTTFGPTLFPPNNPHKPPGHAPPMLFVVGLFLWRSKEQPVCVALLMHKTAIFISFALAQVDRLETNGTEEGTLSAHQSTPMVMATIPLKWEAFKQKSEL